MIKFLLIILNLFIISNGKLRFVNFCFIYTIGHNIKRKICLLMN